MQLDPQTGALLLAPGDPLDDVPASHHGMLSNAARTLFADPRGYFDRLAAACPFARMRDWLAAVAADDGGRLCLHPRTKGYASGSSGYLTQPTGAHPVRYSPPLPETDYDLSDQPADVQAYYRAVNTLWWGYPGSGWMHGLFEVIPLGLDDGFSDATGLDGLSTWEWGATAGGDVAFWYTTDGRAGRLRWEGQVVEPLGTVADLVNNVFAELLAGRAPG